MDFGPLFLLRMSFMVQPSSVSTWSPWNWNWLQGSARTIPISSTLSPSKSAPGRPLTFTAPESKDCQNFEFRAIKFAKVDLILRQTLNTVSIIGSLSILLLLVWSGSSEKCSEFMGFYACNKSRKHQGYSQKRFTYHFYEDFGASRKFLGLFVRLVFLAKHSVWS